MKKAINLILLIGAAFMYACTDVEMQLPKGPKGDQGAEGLSAYEVWVKAVEDGTITDWTGTTNLDDFFKYLKGKDGKDGSNGLDGKSAYEMWVEMVRNHELEDPKNPGNLWPDDRVSKRDFYEFLTGADGDDGNTPYIGENGNWWILVEGKPTDLGIKARGEDGKDGADGQDGQDGKDGADGKDGKDGASPYIGDNGNWWIVIDGTPTDLGVKAKGEDGKDGQDGKDGADGKDGQDGQDGKDGKDGQDGKSAYDLWKEEVLSGGLEDPGNPGEMWDKNRTSLQDFWEYLRGSDGKDGADGILKTEFVYVDYDKSRYNLSPVRAMMKVAGNDTTYEYVNPISGGVAYLVSGPGPVIVPNATVNAVDDAGKSYVWTSNADGYIYVNMNDLPEWTESGRHGGRRLHVKSLSFGGKRIEDPDEISESIIPYKVGLVTRIEKPMLKNECKVQMQCSVFRVFEGNEERWPGSSCFYYVSDYDKKMFGIPKTDIKFSNPDIGTVYADNIEMKGCDTSEFIIISRNISRMDAGFPSLPKYAYVIVGNGENPSTIIMHDDIFRRSGSSYGLKYRPDYGCRVSSFETRKDLVIIPEACEFGNLDTLQSSYSIKMGQTSLFFMFDAKTFGHTYSDEVYTVPDSVLSRHDLETVYSFRRYSGIQDLMNGAAVKYNFRGWMSSSGRLNGVDINNYVFYTLSNFNDAKDCAAGEIKNVYNGFYIMSTCNGINGITSSMYSLYDDINGMFYHTNGSDKATVTYNRRKFVIPAIIEK